MHFLPFQKANRNETFLADDLGRVAPAYSKISISNEPEKDLKTLREYLQTYRSKLETKGGSNKQEEETKGVNKQGKGVI